MAVDRKTAPHWLLAGAFSPIPHGPLHRTHWALAWHGHWLPSLKTSEPRESQREESRNAFCDPAQKHTSPHQPHSLCVKQVANSSPHARGEERTSLYLSKREVLIRLGHTFESPQKIVSWEYLTSQENWSWDWGARRDGSTKMQRRHRSQEWVKALRQRKYIWHWWWGGGLATIDLGTITIVFFCLELQKNGNT